MGTFSEDLTTTAWTEIADGSTDASFGIQIGGSRPVAVAIATTEPAIESDEFVILDRGGDTGLSLDLAETDKVFARALSGASSVRGYTVAR